MGIKRYNWRRLLLSAVLIGACIWCLGSVGQVYSKQKIGTAQQIGMARQASPFHNLQSG